MKKIQLGLGLGLILSLLSLQGVAQKQSLNLEDVVQKRLFTAQLVYGINSMNRLQNQLDIMLADPDNGASTIAYQEKSERFIEEVDDSYLTFTPDSKEFIITSEKSGWRHIYHYDITGKQLYQVTAGNWDVTAILGFDPKAKLVYYQAAEESPLRRNVYAVKLDGTKKHKLSEQEGTNSAIFSTGCKYYINTYSSIATPPLVTLHSANGKLIRVLKDNAKLKELLTKYVLPAKTFYTFKTAEGVVLNGYMYGFTSGLDKRMNTKHVV